MEENEKVKYEVEKVKAKNAIVVLSVLVIALMVVVGLLMQQLKINKTEIGEQGNIDTNKEEQEKITVDFDEVADKLFEAYGIKEEVDKLPQITAEERPIYEKIWKEMVAEEKDEAVKIIKEKYPKLSDKQVEEYATKFFEHIKEYGLRIAKHNQQIIDKAKEAAELADRSNALAELMLKHMQIVNTKGYSSSYVPNEEDLKILQQHVVEQSEGKYTVKIKQDNSGYDVEKVDN